MRRFNLIFNVVEYLLVTCSLLLLWGERSEAGEVVKCAAGYHNVNYYEIKKITRCIVRMDKAKFGDYLAIKSLDHSATLAEGKIIKKKGGVFIILLTKNPTSIRPKFPVEFSTSIPAEDGEISRYTNLVENNSGSL